MVLSAFEGVSVYHETVGDRDMRVGNDLWMWLRFAIELIKIILRIFGDDEDKEAAAKNGIDL